MTLEDAIERLYDLNVGITVGTTRRGGPTTRHERPHKPLFLLAAFDLIDEGKATPDRIPWCQDLRDRFSARFVQVRRQNDQDTPENPFHYLQTDGLWQAWREGDGGRSAVDAPPTVGDIGRVFARFADGFEHIVALPTMRQRLREALISRYFPQLSSSSHSKPNIQNPTLRVADDTPEYGRSPAFRRKILEVYDHQCAACGLRIKLPAGNDVSFIDAAHLIPFSESRNDHPTNGLALCKNHHWAMDRDIIAPGLDHRWHISNLIDPRRSNGEEELHGLAGKSVLLPQDPAFHPDPEGLKWRIRKLSA